MIDTPAEVYSLKKKVCGCMHLLGNDEKRRGKIGGSSFGVEPIY
jgi:hypothetical protein